MSAKNEQVLDSTNRHTQANTNNNPTLSTHDSRTVLPEPLWVLSREHNMVLSSQSHTQTTLTKPLLLLFASKERHGNELQWLYQIEIQHSTLLNTFVMQLKKTKIRENRSYREILQTLTKAYWARTDRKNTIFYAGTTFRKKKERRYEHNPFLQNCSEEVVLSKNSVTP